MHVLMAIGRRSMKAMITDVYVESELLVYMLNVQFNKGTFGKKRRGGFKDATSALRWLARVVWQKLTLFMNPSLVLPKQGQKNGMNDT